MTAKLARLAYAAVAALAAVISVAACGSQITRNAAYCPVTVGAIIRHAPASANDPVTGTWLSQVDRLRDLAGALKDPTDEELAAELNYAGQQVAEFGEPPQVAIFPVQESCTLNDLGFGAVSPAAVTAARTWLTVQDLPSAVAPGMTAGIVTQMAIRWEPCPVPAVHGSQLTRGNGCETWSLTLTTTAGALHVTCGPTTSQFVPDIGDVLYVPAAGRVTAAAGLTVLYQVPWNAFSAAGNS